MRSSLAVSTISPLMIQAFLNTLSVLLTMKKALAQNPNLLRTLIGLSLTLIFMLSYAVYGATVSPSVYIYQTEATNNEYNASQADQDVVRIYDEDANTTTWAWQVIADELAALRAQRLQALQEQLQQQAANQLQAEEHAQQQAEASASLDALMRRYLSPEARSRLARISLVDAERSQRIKTQIVSLHENGSFVPPMSDAALKTMLSQQSKSRSNASVRRI